MNARPQQPSQFVLSDQDIDRLADALAARLAPGLAHPNGRTDLVTLAELATKYAVSQDTIRRRATELGGVKVGNQWRFDPQVVAEQWATQPDPRAKPNLPGLKPRRGPVQGDIDLIPIRGE